MYEARQNKEKVNRNLSFPKRENMKSNIFPINYNHTAKNDKQAIQRYLATFKNKAINQSEQNTIIHWAHWIDAKTELAFNETCNAIKKYFALADPTVLKEIPQYHNGYVDSFIGQCTKGIFSVSSIGYIIEDYVTSLVTNEKSIQIIPQYKMMRARPDFCIQENNSRGIVDITSSRQQGHVFNKRFSPSTFTYIAESIYPSVKKEQFFTNESFDFKKLANDLSVNTSEVKKKKAYEYLFKCLRNNIKLLRMQSGFIFTSDNMENLAKEYSGLVRNARFTENYSNIIKFDNSYNANIDRLGWIGQFKTLKNISRDIFDIYNISFYQAAYPQKQRKKQRQIERMRKEMHSNRKAFRAFSYRI